MAVTVGAVHTPRIGPALSDIGATPARDGRWWVFPSGYRCPVVAGGSGGQGQGGNAGGDAVVDPPAPPAPPTPPAGDPPKDLPTAATLTQADVDKAKREAKKAAIDEVAKTLGCTVEEAKALVDAKRQADDNEKTEAQRAREAADREKAEAAAERAALAGERRSLQTERALMGAGVNADRSAKAARLVLADLADDADEAAIAAAVATFKTDTPEWFAAADPAQPRPPGSDPGGRAPGGGAGGAKTGLEAGRERSRQAKAATPEPNADPLGAFARIG